jgi:hypothetical protein
MLQLVHLADGLPHQHRRLFFINIYLRVTSFHSHMRTLATTAPNKIKWHFVEARASMPAFCKQKIMSVLHLLSGWQHAKLLSSAQPAAPAHRQTVPGRYDRDLRLLRKASRLR